MKRNGHAPPSDLLKDLLNRSVIHPDDWRMVEGPARAELQACPDRHVLLPRLVEVGLLTKYQAVRVGAGRTSGLVLGNYRVLDRLGVGGMGVVYLGEHFDSRRLVAIKVLSPSLVGCETVRRRFDAEMKAVARLSHPHIVAALDAGFEPGPGLDLPGYYYFVMEYVPGQNLEQYVHENGPLPIHEACEVVRQIALALGEAHKHHLIHRDLKPSNVQRTVEGQVKLLDFGLARHREYRITTPGTALGTIDYMAPEQAQDAASIDARADIYGLGGILFWCLTAQPPFALEENTLVGLLCRKTQAPPSVCRISPRLPKRVDALVALMMAADPADRPPTAEAVVTALTPFLATSLGPVTSLRESF